MHRILLILLIFGFSAEASFRFRISEDRGTFDWGNGEVNQDIILQLMSGLTSTDEKGAARPSLAEKWSYDSKKIKYDFFIRKNALWSDGKPVCAEQFVEAWKRVLNKNFASPYAHLLSNIKSFEANDCEKLRVELNHGSAFFPELVSHWVFFPIRNDLMKKFGKDWMKPEGLAVTGPYVLKKWVHDTSITLERNEKYYGAPAKEKEIEAFVVSDDMTALSLYEQGKLDWIRDLPYLEKKKLSKRADYIMSPTLVTYFLGFSFTKDAISKDERCSILNALDTAAIPVFMQGGEMPMKSFAPDYSVEKLAAKKIEMTPSEVQYYAKDIHAPLMEWVQQTIQTKTGTTIGLIKNEGKSYWSKLAVNPPKIFLSGVTAMYAHPHSFLVELRSDSRANWGRFNSRKYDELTDLAGSLDVSTKKGRETVEAALKILSDECAVVPLYQRQTANLVSKKVSGFKMNPLARVYLDTVQVK